MSDMKAEIRLNQKAWSQKLHSVGGICVAWEKNKLVLFYLSIRSRVFWLPPKRSQTGRRPNERIKIVSRTLWVASVRWWFSYNQKQPVGMLQSALLCSSCNLQWARHCLLHAHSQHTWWRLAGWAEAVVRKIGLLWIAYRWCPIWRLHVFVLLAFLGPSKGVVTAIPIFWIVQVYNAGES